jgi:large subunit ribosomal protein L25
MTKHYALSAAKRERAGKGVARALRRENQIPAVIYGDNKAPVSISLPSKETTLEYQKGHMFTTLCDMQVEGAKHLVLVRDVQTHPVTDKIEHIDFLRVNEKTKIHVSVPVHFINHEECKGITMDKGTLNVVRHEIEMVCQAQSIPEEITVDLKGFEIGDAIKISAVKLPEGVTPAITGRDFTIATIIEPKAYVEETTAAPESVEVPATAQKAPDAAAAPAGDKKDAKK